MSHKLINYIRIFVATLSHKVRSAGDLRPVYSDTTQLDIELSCVAIDTLLVVILPDRPIDQPEMSPVLF